MVFICLRKLCRVEKQQQVYPEGLLSQKEMPESQKALLLSVSNKDCVKKRLDSLSIAIVQVPANMTLFSTHLFDSYWVGKQQT